MSILNKVGLGVMLALMIGLGIETYLIHKLDQSYAEEVASNKDLSDKLKEAAESMKTQVAVARVTDKIVTDTANKIEGNADNGKAIKEVVDNIAIKVANEKLTISDADSAYVDSMWSAYCSGNENNSDCSTRFANSKL